MSWLTYADDEVQKFHPEFKAAADEALQISNLEGDYEWIHHIRRPGASLIPDFVLRKRQGQQWILAFEIKRRRESVHSTRNQFQARDYAVEGQNFYPPNAPRYFALSNLEATILFALNDDRPPLECRVRDGAFNSGEFDTDARDVHRSRFIDDTAQILQLVTTVTEPDFEVVWPGVIADFVAFSLGVPYTPMIDISEPDTPGWDLVRDYFGSPLTADSSRLFILRSLICEYLRGILLKHKHPDAPTIPPIQPNQPDSSTANAIDLLRKIDFQVMFGDSEGDMYRSLGSAEIAGYLGQYVSSITSRPKRIVELATVRVDCEELLDSLMTALYPVEVQDECGKVTTDPELASVLVHLAIMSPAACIIDPCCGDGALLSAAYDRLASLGADYHQALSAIGGIEADPVAARLASVRLALKQPASVSPEPQITVLHADMFASAEEIGTAEVILMNPPFKRYEAQDLRPVPAELRQHYAQCIRSIDGQPPVTTSGQANLFNFYVEFVSKAVPEGTRLGVILDNKWYHNRYGRQLRGFLLRSFEIEAIVEYPHFAFFSDWTIATSILIARKVAAVHLDHRVRFVRAKVDPRTVDLNALVAAYNGAADWPPDWTCRTKRQRELDARRGWKSYFAEELANDFRRDDWPTLNELFERSRRGSLQKEEGGIGVLEFPFRRSNYGPRRRRKEPRERRFQTESDRSLTASENALLRALADEIPQDFRGWALRNAGDIDHFEIGVTDVERQQTLEPPRLRAVGALFVTERRVPWTGYHDRSLDDMMRQPEVRRFLEGIGRLVNLTERVLPREELWNVLREPTAGELIIPRKTRLGHRVHVNPFAFVPRGRQVRTSSNFISYGNCVATEAASGLDRSTATRLIAAFLVSSFGQLQFEMEGYNREGLLAVEKAQLSQLRIFDPRWVRPQTRKQILEAFSALTYPVASDRLSGTHEKRNHLDMLFAQEIAAKFAEFDAQALLDEVHTALDDWLIARQP